VEVRLTARDGSLVLTIEDDGRGISERTPGGRGVANMESRATELGGKLEVGPAPDGNGACLTWSVPLRRQA
jgi:signal transduction histidine kinase